LQRIKTIQTEPGQHDNPIRRYDQARHQQFARPKTHRILKHTRPKPPPVRTEERGFQQEHVQNKQQESMFPLPFHADFDNRFSDNFYALHVTGMIEPSLGCSNTVRVMPERANTNHRGTKFAALNVIIPKITDTTAAD